MRKLLLAFWLLSLSILCAQEVVILETNSGNITLKLYPKTAPKACENFITLAKNGYYDGVIFHRVIKNFMIQGGDPTGTGMGGASIWKKPFEDEFSPYTLFEKPYLLAMANSGKNTNGSQFFITTALTPWLNGYHTIFGEVIDGFDVVKAIENAATDAANKPVKPQVIIKAHIKTN
ncbi:MAG: peptidylprolyl isomerase [Campylobacteraceae bacterium]|nr:peptidylprolyl isomerase [Campylobacteraceae bacterium]